MTAVTTGRRGGVHRRPRRPLVESLVELHTGAAELGQILLVSVACWALPVAIVVVAISTRGADHMTEQSTDQTLRDQATAAEMSATEHRRETERLQALLDERTAQLVQVTIERDLARRELDQVQGAERAVRLRVVRAGIDGQPFVAVADIREDLESGGVS